MSLYLGGKKEVLGSERRRSIIERLKKLPNILEGISDEIIYHSGNRDLDVKKPRNSAKSVTVE